MKLKDQGFSLLNTILAMATLGVASLAVFKIMDVQTKEKVSVNKELSAVQIGASFTKKVKRIFLDTKDSQGKLTDGLCSIIDIDKGNTNHSKDLVANILISLPAKGEKLFSEERWMKYMEGLKVVGKETECELTTTYGKCFTLDYNNLDLENEYQKLRRLNPIVKFGINAIKMNPLSKKAFHVLKNPTESKHDVKSIGFEFTISIIYDRGKKKSIEVNDDISSDQEDNFNESEEVVTEVTSRVSKNIKGAVWAGEVGVCDKGGKKLAVVGSGFGDLSGEYRYNVAGFSTNSSSAIGGAPIEIEEIAGQAQSGKLIGSHGNQQAITDDSTLVYSSCNETQFLCPQERNTDHKRRYQAINVVFNMLYNSPNQALKKGLAASISPEMVVGREDGKVISRSSYQDRFTVAGRSYGKGNDGQFYALDSKGKPNYQTPLLAFGKKSVEAFISDKGQNSEASGLCQKVCRKESNFNTSTSDKYFLNFKYKINEKLEDGVPNSYSVFSSTPLACTGCYTKNCTRFGLGTFGPMEKMPTEPLDARIPECVRHETDVVNAELERKEPMRSSDANKCLAYKLIPGDQRGFSLKAFDCSSKKKTMCFGYGKHFLAKNVQLDSIDFAEGRFSDAENICFDLSKEIVQSENLQRLFTQEETENDEDHIAFLGSMGGNGQNFSFYNLVNQGAFLAPIGKNQEQRAREFAERRGERNKLLGEYFWVNLKTDNTSDIYAPAPLIPSKLFSKEDYSWGARYDTGKLKAFKIEDKLEESGVGELYAGDGAILYNSTKFKGIRYVNSTAPYGDEGKLRFLCQNKLNLGKFFVSSKRSQNQNDGESICADENGHFVPPVTTGQWIMAMHMAQPLSSRSNIPNMKLSETTGRDPLWVALKVNEKKESYVSSKTLGIIDTSISKDEVYLNEEGERVETAKPLNTIKYLCLDQDERKFVIDNSKCSISQTVDKSLFLKAMDHKNRILRSSFLRAFEEIKKDELLKLFNK